MNEWYSYPNRTLCDCLEEMRKICKANGNSPAILPSLIEEIQVYANRMEAALSDKADLRSAHKELKKIKVKIKAQEAKLNDSGE